MIKKKIRNDYDICILKNLLKILKIQYKIIFSLINIVNLICNIFNHY